MPAAADPKKKPCSRPWPHPYEPEHPDCALDRQQYERESRRRQTTAAEREQMRGHLHRGASQQQLDQVEDDLDASQEH